MKAYTLSQPGGVEVLELNDIPSAAPDNDEVRIKVRAFGLNRAEVYRRAGKMGPINGMVVPGIEAAGEVLEDPANIFKHGQRVVTAMGGLQFTRHGSYAEEVTVLRSNVIDMEDSPLSWEELAALPESYLTVWGAIGGLIDTQPGQTVLVRGATSSVGLAAVAYAKARGQNVIATTRSLKNAARLKDIGADTVLTDNGRIADMVRDVVPGGVDVVLDVVGGESIRDSVSTLRPFGTAVVIELLGGAPVIDNLHLMNDLPAATRLTFFGSGLLGTPALPLREAPLRWIADRIARGTMPSLRVKTFGFEGVRDAHRLIESDSALGKIVICL